MIKPLEAILTSIEEKSQQSNLIQTGFPTIDRRYFGFAPKEVWVVGAYTGSGKTFFCLQIALNIAKQNKRVVYFSLEMPSEALVARLWGNFAELHPARLEFGMLNLEEYQAKRSGREELLKLKDYFFFDDSCYTVVAIRNVINDLVRISKKPDLCIVDFLQNIQSPKDEYERLSETVVALQQYAKQIDTTFLAASQVSNVEAKEGIKSKIIGFKGSGSIAAAADFGLWLEVKTEYNREIKTQGIDLYFRKCRRGPNYKIPLVINFPSGKVTEKQDDF